MELTYSLASLGLFFVLLVGEFLVPSGGLVGLAAFMMAVMSISLAFSHSLIAGASVVASICIGTPIVFYVMVKQWPHTPLGRRVLNRRPGQLDEPVESRLRSGKRRKDLIGLTGIAKTDLLPGGLIEIDGERLDAFTQGAPIDSGSLVEVISVNAGKIQVRPTSKRNEDSQQAETQQAAQALENSLESLDLDEQ